MVEAEAHNTTPDTDTDVANDRATTDSPACPASDKKRDGLW